MAGIVDHTPKLDRRRLYELRHPDRARAQQTSPERKAGKAKWNREHREQLNAADRARYHANIEAGRAKSLAAAKRYYATAHGKAKRRAWRLANREAIKLSKILGIKIAEARAKIAELDAKV